MLVLGLAGCAAKSGEKSGDQPKPAIAEAWQARCGNCHIRVEPHSRTHAELQAAFGRHQSRTRLTKDEWKQLEDYLASDPTQAQDGTASMARR
jgi:hypothetical protein